MRSLKTTHENIEAPQRKTGEQNPENPGSSCCTGSYTAKHNKEIQRTPSHMV